MMDERIRILLMIFSFDIEAVGGGISRFAVNLSQALDASKFQVALCGLWNHGTQIEQERITDLNNRGIHAFVCAAWDGHHPYKSFTAAYSQLRRELERNPVDIIHSHSLFGDIAALMLHFERKAPIIVRTLHNELRTEWSRRPIRRLLLTNFLYPLLFDVEIGVSRHIAEGLNQRWLARRLGRQAITIHNALDIRKHSDKLENKQSILAKLSIPENAYVVGSVGRLTKQKGYDLLLNAANNVVNAIPNLYLLIIGDGEDAQKLRQQAAHLEIGKKVIFTGSRQDVDALYQGMDLFACSSRWEGLSTVIMEAMAAGVPIVATDIPGNRELLEPGKSAWFVTAENSDALAQGLLKAYTDREQSRVFAEEAQKNIKLFTIDEIARKQSDLYQILRKDKQIGLSHRQVDANIYERLVENDSS